MSKSGQCAICSKETQGENRSIFTFRAVLTLNLKKNKNAQAIKRSVLLRIYFLEANHSATADASSPLMTPAGIPPLPFKMMFSISSLE